MKLWEIQQAVKEGKTVCWKNEGYEVVRDGVRKHYYLIIFTSTGNCTGLTWQDGETLNGEEKDFYIKDEKHKYTVKWEMKISADNSRSAAIIALNHINNPRDSNRVFYVFNQGEIHKSGITVNLSDIY